mmetsp:Transcript_11433/g.32948  ORF Transcript_11433/g.32948 Transcript_11433/m.32948 type:complete len:200 (-) Transcript_11433:282-881(-)
MDVVRSRLAPAGWRRIGRPPAFGEPPCHAIAEGAEHEDLLHLWRRAANGARVQLWPPWREVALGRQLRAPGGPPRRPHLPLVSHKAYRRDHRRHAGLCTGEGKRQPHCEDRPPGHHEEVRECLRGHCVSRGPAARRWGRRAVDPYQHKPPQRGARGPVGQQCLGRPLRVWRGEGGRRHHRAPRLLGVHVLAWLAGPSRV